jgi:hypothetical protein
VSEKKMAFQIGLDQGNAEFEFDMSEFTDEKGEITEEGRTRLMARVMARVKGQIPDADLGRIERVVQGMLTSGDAASISARSILAVLDTAYAALDGINEGVLMIARNSGTPAHIYQLGEVNAYVAAARAQIACARKYLRETVECKSCAEHRDKAEPSAPHN